MCRFYLFLLLDFFFFKQKTAYEMRISDWSSDVCSSDLTSLAYSSYVGVIGTGRIKRGRIKPNTPVAVVNRDGTVRNGRVLQVLRSEERRVGKECVSTC